MKKITKFNFLTSANDALGIAKGCLVTFILLIATALPAAAQNGEYILDHHNQDVVVKNDNDDTAVRTPFLSAKRNSKTQYLYFASELEVAPNVLPSGLGSKTIQNIGFYVTSFPSVAPYTISNMKIRMGNTSLETLGSSSTTPFGEEFGTPAITGDATKDEVLGDFTYDVPPFSITELGLNIIDLGTGFVWDGYSNILIEFSISTPNGQASTFLQVGNGKSYQVEGTEWTQDPNNYRSRIAHTYRNNNTSGGIQGSAMIVGGANANVSYANNSMVVDVAHRKFRPNIRFQMSCASMGNPGGVTVKYDETSVGGCRKMVLKVDNGNRAQGVVYEWQRSSTETFDVVEILPLGNTSSFTITQEVTGKYYRRRSTCGGDNIFSEKLLIPGAPLNTYNTIGGWSAGTPNATSDNMLNINSGNPTLTADAAACGCIIGAGANLVVTSGNTLQVDGAVKVSPSGSLTINDGASLVQVDPTAPNSGVISVRRNSQPMVAYDYTYWASPVLNQNLGSFSSHTLTDKFYKWSTTAQNWVNENVANNFQPGVGYIIRAPQATFPGATYAGSPSGPFTGTYVHNGIFTGAANNGTYNVPITLGTNKMNFIANPYPSPLDLEEFYNANSSKLDGTFYFWTHNTPITGQAYTGNDYAMYNVGTGGVVAISGGVIPSKFLAVGQSVQVKAKSGTSVANSNVTYKNTMRRAATVSSPFFRVNSNVSVDANATSKSRFWLNLTTATAFKQVLIGYINGATNNFDSGFDGDATAGAAISFYSIADGHQLAIQGRSVFNVNDQVVLGFKTNAAGVHTIELPQTEGVFGSQQIYLVDNIANVTHNLKEGAYSFTSAAGTFNDRFILKYVGLTSSLGVAENSIEQTTQGFVAYKKANDLVINSSASEIDMIQVYDLSGRMLTQQNGVNAKQLTIANPNWSSQVLIVQMHTADKLVLTKKVVF